MCAFIFIARKRDVSLTRSYYVDKYVIVIRLRDSYSITCTRMLISRTQKKRRDYLSRLISNIKIFKQKSFYENISILLKYGIDSCKIVWDYSQVYIKQMNNMCVLSFWQKVKDYILYPMNCIIEQTIYVCQHSAACLRRFLTNDDDIRSLFEQLHRCCWDLWRT